MKIMSEDWAFLKSALLGLALASFGATAGAGDLDLTGFKWKGGSVATQAERIKEGDVAIRWDAGLQPYGTLSLTESDFKEYDWSKFNTLRIWVFSELASGSKITVGIFPDTSTETPEVSFYQSQFTVNWEGWQEIELPLSRFKKISTPDGWSHISRIEFISHLSSEPIPGTILFFSGIKLVE
jgi:hypothetical protein